MYVGDDLRDIQAARAAGMATVAAGWGYCGQTESLSWGADAMAESPLHFSQLSASLNRPDNNRRQLLIGAPPVPTYELQCPTCLSGATWFRQGLQSSAVHTEG